MTRKRVAKKAKKAPKAKRATKQTKKAAKPKAKVKTKPKSKPAAKLQTTSSGGGPVIGIPVELAGQWRGTLAPIDAVVPAGWSWGTAGGPVCDYDRACGNIEHRVSMPYGGFGSIPLGSGLALVFQGPLSTSWVPTAEGGVVVRNIDDEDRFGRGAVAEALKLVAAVPAANWKSWPQTITLRDGRICFWDSAMEGADDPSEIPTNDTGLAIGTPGAGTYQVSTAVDDADHEYVKLTRV